MKPGVPQQLTYAPRHGHLTAAYSIRDFYDAIVELMTNADDSYRGLFQDGHTAHDGGPILIEIEPHRGDHPSVVRVRDRAGGFSGMLKKLATVGERTSRPGDRGFMARGLRDCAALGHLTIETIVNQRLDKAEITSAFELVPYEPGRRGGDLATPADRKRLGIARGSGTSVELRCEPRVRVPQLETLRRDLAWHYALRDIMRNGSGSTVLLRYSGAAPEPITNVEPDGDVVYDREESVPDYPAFRFRFKLVRAHDPLEDPADPRFRRSGILLKGARAIYGCSFPTGDLERDPAASRYFGRIECEGIDGMAEDWDARRAARSPHPPENPIFILDPNRRGGLAAEHPFMEAVLELPTQVIREQFEKERRDREQRRQLVEAKETTDRLRRLAREASRFMREKLDDLGSVSPGDTLDDRSFNKAGIGISPAFTQIPLGETKAFYVKVNNSRLRLPAGTSVPIEIVGGSQSLSIVGEPDNLEPDPLDPSLLKATFIVRGDALGPRTRIRCQVDSLESVYAEAEVIPFTREEIEVPGGLAFHRKSYSVRHGGRRTLVLRSALARAAGLAPRVILEPAGVAVLRSRGVLEHVPGARISEAEILVEGKQPNGRCRVTAEVNGKRVHCELRVTTHDDDAVILRFRLVDHDLGANYRAVWDRREANTLLITTRHESIGRYLGPSQDGYPGQHGDAFRVLLAELIADNVCRRIVEEHARAQRHQFDSDKLYLLHNKLMKEFTPIAHRIQLSDPITVSS